MEIDGFQINNEIDEDEELIFCSLEDPLIMPDYANKCGCCEHCKCIFEMIEDAVLHIHKRHGILGCSHYTFLVADWLLKEGYVSVLIDNVDTVITDAGKIDQAAKESSEEKVEAEKSKEEKSTVGNIDFEVSEELCV